MPGRTYELCVDFDGTIHSYKSGWKGEDVIPDPPIEGAFEWLYRLLEDGRFVVNIYSSRSKFPSAVAAMIEWFRKHGFPETHISLLKFPTQKPAAFLTIDDRAIVFEGTYPDIETMVNFKPWNKR